MLERSFIFLRGVGAATERRLWSEGISNWDDFLGSRRAGPLSGERKREADSCLMEARKRYREGDLPFLAGLFSGSQTWRLYDELKDGALFVDIETMGTRRGTPITVIGVYDGRTYQAAVRGTDLDGERVASLLKDAKLLVTFNGASFDLPIIRWHFPGAVPDVPHLDLRFLSRRCGLSGGLKSIEHQTGIARPAEVQGMSGEDAVRLWGLYERDGNRNALKLLLKYNMEDIVNLRPLSELLVPKAERLAVTGR